MSLSPEQRDGGLMDFTRIAAGVILGIGCFGVVLAGGLSIGQGSAAMLESFSMVGPVNIASLQ